MEVSGCTVDMDQVTMMSGAEGAAYSPTQRLVSSSAVDLLLIETVPLAQSVVEELYAEAKEKGEVDEKMLLDDLYYRIEGYGYRVGKGLSEIFTRERARFADQLDIMKFICKELWMVLYKKQIDNLKTNHRGTYVLIDNGFKYCQRMSTSSSQNSVKQATPFLYFPAGIIRGVLAGLGVHATVTFDTVQLPAVSFSIHTR